MLTTERKHAIRRRVAELRAAESDFAVCRRNAFHPLYFERVVLLQEARGQIAALPFVDWLYAQWLRATL